MSQMGQKAVATDALARHLHSAIERVREDMAKVEFWADAMTSFSEPVPEYHAEDVKVWLPSEQATRLSAKSDVARRRSNPAKRRQRRA